MRSSKGESMRLQHLIQLVLAMSLSSLLISCGNINEEPLPGEGDQTTQNSKITKNNEFYVYFASVNNAKPELGDNAYVARFVRAKDLKPLSADAKVTFTCEMPQMPEMGTTEVAGQRQADGSYNVSLFYSMGGRWQITIKIEDGASTDVYTHEVAL